MTGFNHIQGEYCSTCNHTFQFFFQISKCFIVQLFSSPSSVHQQDSFYEACDNVYEDVENINKFILGQNSRKRKGGLKSKNVHIIQWGVFI